MDPFHMIERSEEIIVDQQTNPLESCCKCLGCCCADFRNVYDIIVPYESKSYKFTAKEESGSCARMCCNPNHALVLNISDESGKQVLKIDKPFRCCCFAICGPCQKEITVSRQGDSSSVIGFVKQPCFGGCCKPQLDMFREENGRPIGSIKGPTCCIGGCCRSEFEIEDSAMGKELATIKRGGVRDIGAKKALLSNSDKYKLIFKEPETTTIDDKLVMVSSLLLVDYLFFEGETNCVCNACVCPPQCMFKICDLYCCGCSLPCRVKCFIPEKEKD